MLQRASSNAYSCWRESHIRTKHSKWLRQSLQDMEEKVKLVLKMIEEDGDTFAERAEMYYKKRPELIHFVEESYRSFQALAERYHLMSNELQYAAAKDDQMSEEGKGVVEEEGKEHFVMDSSSLSGPEMGDMMDELVSKVIHLEVAVSSQTAMIQRLREENEELQRYVHVLEDDKASLIDGKNSKNNHLQMQFTDASCDLDEISHKLPSVKLGDKEIDLPESDKEFTKTAVAEVEDTAVGEEGKLVNKNDVSEEIAVVEEVKIIPEETTMKKHVNDEIPFKERQDQSFIQEEEGPESVPLEKMAKQKEEEEEEEEPNWQQLFMKGLEGKEKVILNEYTSILRNFKETKKRLVEVENACGDSLMELKELKLQNANKDKEIQSLRYKLIMLQKKMKGIQDGYSSFSDPEKDDDVLSFPVEEPEKISPVEEKLRGDIDEILEENLNFWMRFSSSFSQVQNLQGQIENLRKELLKIDKEKKKIKNQSSTPDPTQNNNNDAKPIYKHLKEIHSELTVWLEKSIGLKDELKVRFSQQCKIQEDITRALSDGAVDEEMKFTSYQAAKLQGEVLNMQQENVRVEHELEAAVEHVSSLQTEVETTLIRLNEELGVDGSKSSGQMGSQSKNQIPLRAFIFGSMVKKPKSSMQPSGNKKH